MYYLKEERDERHSRTISVCYVKKKLGFDKASILLHAQQQAMMCDPTDKCDT